MPPICRRCKERSSEYPNDNIRTIGLCTECIEASTKKES